MPNHIRARWSSQLYLAMMVWIGASLHNSSKEKALLSNTQLTTAEQQKDERPQSQDAKRNDTEHNIHTGKRK
jgi:hypothetical protein